MIFKTDLESVLNFMIHICKCRCRQNFRHFWNQCKVDVVPVAIVEALSALKFSRFESFLALKLMTRMIDFRVLKLSKFDKPSRFEYFRALKYCCQIGVF